MSEIVAAPDAPVRWDDPTLHEQLRFLDSHLGPRRFVTGDGLTLADFSVAGMMTYARAAGFPFGRHPGIAQ